VSVRFQRIFLVLAMLVVSASLSLAPSGVAVAQTTTTATTTDQLNMRTGPSTTNPVILVIPYGATVTVRGGVQNGFYPVTYNGQQGWSSSDYLALAKPSTNGPQAGVATDFLNLRSGPSGSHPVIAVIPSGADLVINGESSGGYLSVTWSGFQGFAHRDWIRVSGTTSPGPTTPVTPPASGTAVTTDSLNLRAGAGTNFTVLAVMPAGATVTLTGQTANGFYGITWNGNTGWAAAEYLRVTSGQAPTPAPTTPPTPVPTLPPTPAPTAPPVTSTRGTAITTDVLNMRTGPATTYPVVLVIPVSATVQLTGGASGNYLEVTYSGRTGWAHKEWIKPQQTETRPTSSARVTESLNLRSGPATTYGVLTVMPAGATVILTGQESNGFHSVTFNGQTGWAFSTYLDITPAGQPQPTIPPTPVPTQPPQPQPTEPTLPTPPASNLGFATTNAIVGPTRGTPEQAIAYAQNAGALRMDEVERYIREIYRMGPQIGFDPALLVAQSALETGYWKSHWWNTRLNPAGLGITDDPNVHEGSQGFSSGTVSARAQMAHMHAEVFGSRVPLPAELQGVDVTYEAVFQAGWAGTIVTLEDLSGTWATDPLYASKIVRVAIEIFG
jgi:uncharacterized protein YraI